MFIKKHITTHHLQGEFYNRAITDKKPVEIHPALILDWKNKVASLIDRKDDNVLILKLVNGVVVKKSEGEFTTEKLKKLLN